MKAYILVVLAVTMTLVGSIHPKGFEDILSVKQEIFDQCIEEYQISKGTFESIVNQKDLPDEYQIKCWLSCVLEKLDIIKEGKIEWEQCKILTKYFLTKEEGQAKSDKIAEIC